LRPNNLSDDANNVLKKIHKTVDGVSKDYENFHFNKAVARIRELTNELEAFSSQEVGAGWVRRQGLEAMICLIGPMMPHLGEELWHSLGNQTLLVETPWPEADLEMLIDQSITIGVQVNGKFRGTITLPKDCQNEAAKKAALALESVRAAIGSKAILNVIIVPNRIINVVL